MKVAGGAYEGPHSLSSRFEEGAATNPEELIAAATFQQIANGAKEGCPIPRLLAAATITLEATLAPERG